VTDGSIGIVAWYRGDFANARAMLEEATAALAGSNIIDYESTWFVPNETIASTHTHLALARFVQGDLGGAEEQLTATIRRVAELGFPQGPYSLAYERCYEVWVRIELGQLDKAAEIVAQLKADAKRHGFDFWVLMATAQQVAVNGLALLSSGKPDPAQLQTHIATMTFTVQSWRAAEATLFVSFYDAVLAQLLAAAGKPDEARERLDVALQLGEGTDVNFYRAELLRLRAHTTDDADARDADLRAAIETAREQKAPIFELRAAIDDFELPGESSRDTLTDAISRFPADSDWPDLVRARTLLG
jgi:tetratricopeptide (TPR) repeat protein